MTSWYCLYDTQTRRYLALPKRRSGPQAADIWSTQPSHAQVFYLKRHVKAAQWARRRHPHLRIVRLPGLPTRPTRPRKPCPTVQAVEDASSTSVTTNDRSATSRNAVGTAAGRATIARNISDGYTATEHPTAACCGAGSTPLS